MSYFPRPVREITTEDKLALVDRMYQPGDLLKRSVDDVRSGIVTRCVVCSLPLPHASSYALYANRRLRSRFCSTTVKGHLEHAVSRQSIPGWKTIDEVETAVEVDMGDLVVYNDWVGQVCTNAPHFVLSKIEFPIPSLLGY